MTEAYEWIKGIIASCNSTFHFEAVDKIIDLFEQKYGPVEELTELKCLRYAQWLKVHHVEI